MSGFAAVFRLDGAPVEPAWLEKMADFLTFRGPDGREVCVSGCAGMCHTLLRVSAETDGRPQIASRGGYLSCVGEVRIDDRQNLLSKLPPDSNDSKSPASAELVLRAYQAWGEACIEHLLGDFSFVIWDARRRRVLAARDHLGVRPLFYSHIGQHLVISNTLDCIRQLPIVSDELNERTIGDLLLVGRNWRPTETCFAAIQRLAVAHRLIAGADGVRTERYWTLPIDEPIYYKRASDYVDQFRELLRDAIRDRLPDGRVGIFMSGGLDSPTLAATAVGLGAPIIALTSVWDRLIPDQERYYSGLVASHLKIPIFYTSLDDEPWGWEPGAAPIHTPEPVENPLAIDSRTRYLGAISQHCRTVLRGDGPDAALFCEWRRYFAFLVARRKWGRLLGDLATHARVFKRIPFQSTLVAKWKEKTRDRSNEYMPSFPKYLRPGFDQRVGLAARWEEVQKEAPSPHPIRHDAYACFSADFPMDWDAGNGAFPGYPSINELHPFWDVRLLRFLLAVPVIPWCRDKYLIRAAAKGLIPERVRTRPKTPLAGIPYLMRIRQLEKPDLPMAPQLAEYVDERQIPEWPGRNPEETDHALRLLSLNYWLLAR